MHNNIKYRHPTLLQDARMKQGTKGDGTKAYELLLKVPRTPTLGISPEKKLVDRFLEMVNIVALSDLLSHQHFVFQQGRRDEYTGNLQKAKVCEASNGCWNCAPQQVARQVPAVSFQHIIISSTEDCKCTSSQ
jgi:NifB/MoaA-like Fe-S oxidoreductase